jgi:peptidoglycan-associated lipoprotein
MKRISIIAGLMVFVFSLSLFFVTGCATDQAVKSEAVEGQAIEGDASMNDILAEETAKAKKEYVAFMKAQAAKKKAAQEQLQAEADSVPNIHFSFDRYDLRPDARGVLRDLAGWLTKHEGWEVTIEGHCDERGTIEYNLALGERRAEAAKAYLRSLGVPDDRITTISYGEERPLDPRSNEEAWSKNRRDHFVVVPKK